MRNVGFQVEKMIFELISWADSQCDSLQPKMQPNLETELNILQDNLIGILERYIAYNNIPNKED